ncbi:unnamed protein product [Brassica oleracea var. botrytis]|uniref:hAT-like transposase RNase-H fold domain-containing protein n=1 Tax=Brassica oleracea TaxID=3712 RepID=A0A3P6EUX9_BRAOL|nr:unnamed protein product [Brassica oleracea]
MKFGRLSEEYSDILAVAAVLDPRLKFHFLECCFSVLDQSTCKRRLANVCSKIYKLFGAYKKNQRISSAATTSQGEIPDVLAGYGVMMFNLVFRDSTPSFLRKLLAVAREVLSIPIPTVASESSFSIGSDECVEKTEEEKEEDDKEKEKEEESGESIDLT